jgi:thiol-disulfide isomerase/thioredoxin
VGGKLIRATTDDAGGFTLHGLRPGGPYTVIAEADDPQGLITGRSSVRAPNAQVQIRLRDLEDPPPVSASAPTRRVSPISSREQADDEPQPAPARKRRINEEDLPPAPEADVVAPSSASREPDRAASRVPRLAPPVLNTGWRRGDSPSEAGDSEELVASQAAPSTDRPEPTNAPPATRPADDQDEGPNPLPPAIEPERSSALPARTRFRPAAPASTPVPTRSEPVGEPLPEPRRSSSAPAGSIKPAAAEPASEPSPTEPATNAPAASEPPAGEKEKAAETTGDASPMPSPAEAADLPAPSEAPATPAEPQTQPSPATEPASSSSPEVSAPQTRREPKKPAAVVAATPPAAPQVNWDPPYDPFAVVAAAAEPVSFAPVSPPATRPAAPPTRPMTGANPAPPRQVGRATSAPAASRSAGASASPAPASAPGTRTRLASLLEDKRPASCNFDSRHQRLVDFKLPDLQGQPIRFQELDADLILLDFWGTWCSYCTQSIPHLVELQKQLGPQRLKIVGIAYEEGPIEERVKAVSETARKLGINYTVLLGGVDGPCPLQAALHVQAYPTLILIDRYGRVLWRDQGASPGTMTKLDRVVASVGRGDHVRR